MDEPHIRWMIRRDMPEVLAIEDDSFRSPWSEDDFLRELRQRSVIGMVAESLDRVLGYVLYEVARGRLEIITLAVAARERRRGIGRELVTYLQRKLLIKMPFVPRKQRKIELLISERNLAGQLFFRAAGFRAVQVLRGHYDETGDDAYRMIYRPPVGELPTNRIAHLVDRSTPD